MNDLGPLTWEIIEEIMRVMVERTLVLESGIRLDLGKPYRVTGDMHILADNWIGKMISGEEDLPLNDELKKALFPRFYSLARFAKTCELLGKDDPKGDRRHILGILLLSIWETNLKQIWESGFSDPLKN